MPIDKWIHDHLGGGQGLAAIGTLANFIPGVGPIIGAGLTAAGGFLDAGHAQGQADMARKAQSDYLNFVRSKIDAELQNANQSPYPSAGPWDQYSPAWNEAATGAFRDDTAKALQAQMAGLDYTLRPMGGIRSSAMEYAKAQALRDASAQNAAFMRNLRLQGGVERYNNMVRASDEQFRRKSSLLGMEAGLGSGYGDVYKNAQENANAANQGLAGSLKALTQLGLGTGPRNGKTGNTRGDGTLNVPYAGTPPISPWLQTGGGLGTNTTYTPSIGSTPYPTSGVHYTPL